MRISLVLNATVDPSGVPFTLRSDPIERLDDYRWALERWIGCPGIDQLIFVENSGYDIDELRDIVGQATYLSGDSIEFLSFNGQNFPRHLGKGYGETLNLEYAINNSKLLSTEDSMMIRVNGRYFVENIHSFLETLRPPTEMLSDLRQSLTWANAAVLGGTIRFFRDYVCPYGREVDDSKGYFFEHALARALHRGIADGLVWSPYPELPLVRGFSGTFNKSFSQHYLRRKGREVKYKLKLKMLRE